MNPDWPIMFKPQIDTTPVLTHVTCTRELKMWVTKGYINKFCLNLYSSCTTRTHTHIHSGMYPDGQTSTGSWGSSVSETGLNAAFFFYTSDTFKVISEACRNWWVVSECRRAVKWNNLPVNSEQRDAGSCSISSAPLHLFFITLKSFFM